MERRRLHSMITFGVKFILPVFWMAALVRAFLQLRASDIATGLGFALFCLITGGFVLRQAFGLKKVYTDGQCLYVSDYLQEVSVPLEAIERVTQLPMNNSPVTIHLSKETEFGRTVRFFPTCLPINSFRKHPVVAELREAAHCKMAVR